MTFEDEVARLAALLVRSERIVLTGHVNIDGDSLGSMLAMAHALLRRGKRVLALCFEPLLGRYAFLDPRGIVEVFDPIRHGSDVADADCFMMFDFSAWSRMPGLAERVRASRAVKVCFDHHPAEQLPGDINLHVPTAPATGKVVLDVLRVLAWPLDREIAEPLLVAIGTDTGWFRNRNTSPEVMADVATLLATGVDASEVYREVYQRNEIGLVRLIGRVAQGLAEECEGRLLSARIPYAWVREFGVGAYETDEILDLLRTAQGAELVALFREMENGSVRVNLRSRGRIDVSRIAHELGGGGHAYAAGVTLTGPLGAASEQALDKLRAALASPQPFCR